MLKLEISLSIGHIGLLSFIEYYYLFDDDVMHNVKEVIVQAMLATEEKQVPAKRAVASSENLRDKSLSSFATLNTRLLFKKVKIPDTFLRLAAVQWNENQDSQIAKAPGRYLAVTNDHAERNVALVQNFFGRITKVEEQLQYFLQVATHYRKSIPQTLKQTFNGH